MNRMAIGNLATTALAAVALSGCWWDSTNNDTTTVATSNAAANVTAATVSAVTGNAFSFSSGVPAFGTSAATTVTFTGASAFSVASGANSATGTTSYGSCIFTIVTSNFPAGSPLAAGQPPVVITPCQINSQVSGHVPSSTSFSAPTILVLGTTNSSPVNLPTILDPSGNVIINNTTVGSVTLGPSTGATGGGS